MTSGFLTALGPALADPFEQFRLVVGALAVWELTDLVLDLRRGYVRAFRLLEGVGGRFGLHELLRATVRLQLLRLVVRPRGWEEIRILLVQAAALLCGVLTWHLAG
ncbi:MAG: hypothetical protein HZA54_19435 [Planctomycetes bacterium]|nr:hypothetical protein [Planctomycetota bacterium]